MRDSRHFPTPAAVRGDGDVITVTPVCDTSAYATGDLLFNFTSLAQACREVKDDLAFLKSVTIFDKDNQKQPMDLFIARNAGSLSMGTLNVAPSITAANMAAVSLQYVGSILASDYITINSTGLATRQDFSLPFLGSDALNNVYLTAITRGTPTQTASGLILQVGVLYR